MPIISTSDNSPHSVRGERKGVGVDFCLWAALSLSVCVLWGVGVGSDVTPLALGFCRAFVAA